MKIIYKGYIYEALFVNDSMLKYANEVVERILNKDYFDFIGYVEVAHGKYEIITKIIKGNDSYPNYQPILDFETGKLLGRIITVHINVDKLNLVLLKEDLYHELLHSVDPKINNISFIDKNFGAGNYVTYNGNNLKEYKNQPIEREVHLTTLAKKAVEGRLKNNGIEKTKKDILNGKILEALDKDLITNKKEFLKLCYLYFIDKVNNVNN